jgi:hypothetical protein
VSIVRRNPKTLLRMRKLQRQRHHLSSPSDLTRSFSTLPAPLSEVFEERKIVELFNVTLGMSLRGHGYLSHLLSTSWNTEVI